MDARVSTGGDKQIGINLQDGAVIFNMRSDLAVKAADEIEAQLNGIAKGGKGPKNVYWSVRGFSFRLPPMDAKKMVKEIRDSAKACSPSK